MPWRWVIENDKHSINLWFLVFNTRRGKSKATGWLNFCRTGWLIVPHISNWKWCWWAVIRALASIGMNMVLCYENWCIYFDYQLHWYVVTFQESLICVKSKVTKSNHLRALLYLMKLSRIGLLSTPSISLIGTMEMCYTAFAPSKIRYRVHFVISMMTKD